MPSGRITPHELTLAVDRKAAFVTLAMQTEECKIAAYPDIDDLSVIQPFFAFTLLGRQQQKYRLSILQIIIQMQLFVLLRSNNVANWYAIL